MRYPGMFKLIIVMVLCPLCLSALHATTGVRELRSTPDMRSAPDADYALHAANDGGASVTLIDVHGGGGDWLRADPARLPPLPGDAPVAGKSALQWFYGAVVGWMPVPAGWRLQRAEIGMDGGTVYTYASPDGASAGWITYTVIPACLGCMLDETNGLLPGAGERLATLTGSPESNLGQTQPVMSWQSRPDECTALFRYRSGALTVHAAVLSSVPISALDSRKGDLAVADVYAALPAGKSGAADYLLGHFRQAFPACHSPNGWPG
ncbi:hypothetical protein [Dyella sp. EPa41]|uniref:hypothetical protein n=1 Tax=Dyella sp. EPa41 TaxID=1561194 RepID=UPI00191696B5|nr:hypothetical protein [Dyella sp. EPa41]